MKKICFIAQFPPPMHGLSKAVETLYNSNLNVNIDPHGEFRFEKVDITNNKNIIKNLLKISRSKADLFYFTISQTKGGNLRDLVIFKLLELQHKKCLIHLHGGYYRQLVDNDMSGWQRKANYKAIKKLAGAIVLSESLKSIFEGMIDEDKIFVVENCADDQYLLTDQEIEDKLAAVENKQVLHVLWLSNFIRSKGYPFVLEMAKAEKERVDTGEEKRFHFDFAGKFFDESEKAYFESYVKESGLEEYIAYHGVVGGEEKRKLLKECDLFALPTRYLLLWLVLSIEDEYCAVVTPQFVEPSDSGLRVKRSDECMVVTFDGRREYLAERGPSVALIWTKKYGMLVKGCFAPWQGAFGKQFSCGRYASSI